ncbi:MAG: L-threonylcarbamoyladenylate synthase [Parcubacteria group bacterium]
MEVFKEFSGSLAEIIKNGGVGVLPTDTVYGLVASALQPASVERIYRLRKRNPDKPMIILISSLEDLKLFDIKLDEESKKILMTFWPGQVSAILPCPSEKFVYLHRGQDSLAFRWPDKKDLLELLRKTGPLVAPSANQEGKEAAKTIAEAWKCFGEKADFYVDGGLLDSPPSTLVAIENGKLAIKRKGAVDGGLL